MDARQPTATEHRSEIRTGRLRLRALSLPAIDALWREDTETLDGLTGLAWPAEAPPTLTEHLPLIRGRLEDGDAATWWVWSIAAANSSEVLGAAGFTGPPDDHGLVWVGYSLYADHRGMGFATEAVAALLGWAFAREQVAVVLATIAPDNRPSQAVASRVGLRFHRHQKPMDVYRVTRGQWEAGA